MTVTATQLKAVQGRWNTLVEDGLSLPTLYPNEAPGERSVDRSALWAHLSFKDGDSLVTEFGSSHTFRSVGLLLAALYGPVGSGEAALRAMADSIVPLFRLTTVSGIRFQSPSIVPIGITDGGKGELWQINVSMPWKNNLIV